MDVAYNQHSSFRRKSRSSVNLNHLSLAPLTSKLPIDDVSDNDMTNPTSAPPTVTSYSYLQGKSAPTTPRLLSRSPGPNNRSASVSGTRNSRSAASLSKSKSSSHLPHNNNRSNKRQSSTSLHTSPTTPRRSSHHPNQLKQSDRSDSDWLLRCGSIISLETRESKGQAWLSTRASSTSLAGFSPQDAEDEAFERELAREREELVYGSRHTSRHPSRHASRRSSVHIVDDDNISSPAYSRFGSRSHSRVGSMTPGGSSHRMTTFVEDYFNSNGSGSTPLAENPDEEIAGPDFVNLDEELENYTVEDEEFVNGTNGAEDEAYVRKLVKSGNGGVGSWFGHVLGVKLFAVEEDDEEESEDDYDGETTDGEGSGHEMERRVSSLRRLEGQNMKTMVDESIPPPKENEGGWHDAAWLLTVASKVLL
ncbi:hypothetical protein QBC40DRAFT_92883 [Triangularia verruculosa]|uniref:Uncharacterized protein n=1 Tax=Triangularia verruculosa TaxID=2587418 RepID=A0AAN7AT85_9PEZI|nr:hypothetical protein QBC40DRAFT_92883 [Triangularia verruculosa]